MTKEKSHLQSVYSQQKCHLKSLGDPLCPCLAFFWDLSAALLPWQAAGDSIIFMADVNGDICQPEIDDLCRAHSLREAIMSAHPHLPLLTTFL